MNRLRAYFARAAVFLATGVAVVALTIPAASAAAPIGASGPMASAPSTVQANPGSAVTAVVSALPDQPFRQVPGDPDDGRPLVPCGGDNDGEIVITIDRPGPPSYWECSSGAGRFFWAELI